MTRSPRDRLLSSWGCSPSHLWTMLLLCTSLMNLQTVTLWSKIEHILKQRVGEKDLVASPRLGLDCSVCMRVEWALGRGSQQSTNWAHSGSPHAFWFLLPLSFLFFLWNASEALELTQTNLVKLEFAPKSLCNVQEKQHWIEIRPRCWIPRYDGVGYQAKQGSGRHLGDLVMNSDCR